MLRRYLRDVAIVSIVLFTAATAFQGHGITGFLTLEQEARVSITGQAAGEISRFAFDDVLTIGESTSIDIELENEGAKQVEPVGYSLQVYDANNTLLYTYPGEQNLTLGPGELHTRTIRHTPHETGSYFIRLNAEFGNDRASTSEYLFVQDEAEPVPPDPGSVTIVRRSVEYIEPPEPPAPVRTWQVTEPDTATVAEGSTTSVPVTITGTGNRPIENVRITVRSPEKLNITYTPQILFAVPPNETKTFLLTVAAPEGSRGTADLSYRVRSERLQGRGAIDVSIEPELTAAQLREQIALVEDLVQRARIELEAARSSGVAVAAANASLATAREDLSTARSALASGDFAATRDALTAARGSVDTTFQRLFEAEERTVEVRAPLVRPVYLVLVFSVIAAAILVGGYYYIQEQRTRRPELLREEGE